MSDAFLNFLLYKVRSLSSGIAIISVFDCDDLGVTDLSIFEVSGLLRKTNPATHMPCLACDDGCLAPVTIYPKSASNPEEKIFITCRNGKGRTSVHLDDLKQWQVSTRQIAKLVANLCNISQEPTQKGEQWQVSLITGKKHKGILFLDLHHDDGVQCEINGQYVPLLQVLSFDGQTFAMDVARLKVMADCGVNSTGKVSHKRELNRAETQAMYQDWQKEYKVQKAKTPKATDSAIAKRIAKMDIAQGRDWDTIRKNMIKT